MKRLSKDQIIMLHFKRLPMRNYIQRYKQKVHVLAMV